MGRSQDLITAGITIDAGDGINDKIPVDILVAKGVIDNFDVFELFAKEFGWTEEIPDLENIGSFIPNPMSKYQKCPKIVNAWVSEIFKAIVLKKGEQNGREQAQAIIDQLLPQGEDNV